VGQLQTPEAQIVLGAAVLDDVLGLTILAVVKAIVESGKVSFIEIGLITAKAVLFVSSAIIIGQYLAESIGLAPIVGAFAAGLVLEPVHFSHFDAPTIVEDIEESVKEAGPELKKAVSNVLDSLSRSHIQDLIRPLSYFLVPIFFVLTGMEVRLETLFNLPILLLTLAVAAVAFGGKIVAGLVAGRVNKAIIGWGMVPRGEVGLIFAAMGKSMGVVSDEIFSIHDCNGNNADNHRATPDFEFPAAA
jgi:Kef-type K+ transport system membrane component KefB